MSDDMAFVVELLRALVEHEPYAEDRATSFLADHLPGWDEGTVARPRRSRVQEMAEAWTREGKVMHADAIATHAIRAVCGWVLTELQHDRQPGPLDIEREFLEPR